MKNQASKKQWTITEKKLYTNFFCKKLGIVGQDKFDLEAATRYCETQAQFISYVSPFYNTKVIAKPIEPPKDDTKKFDIDIKVVR